jgi:hypothetical protein
MAFPFKKWLCAWTLMTLGAVAWALPPFWTGKPLPKASLTEQLVRVEKALQGAGFTLLGRYIPADIPNHGTVIFTDKSALATVRVSGDHSILAAPMRAGVNSNGDVSYTNPEYWFRAYFRQKFSSAEGAEQALQSRLTDALGKTGPLGGDVPAQSLADYQYMAGMERLDSWRNELRAFPSFEEALKTVQNHLAQGVEGTAPVYEIVLPEQQMAVLGVAMNQPGKSDGWWVNKLGPVGPQHVAALPYEIEVIGNKVFSPFGRFRIALAWPALDLSQFMSIRYAPDVIQQTMKRLAGATEASPSMN